MATDYEAVIGLEVHVELKTKSKIFCSCPTTFGGESNTHVCPGCLGLPGVLPVLNRKVVEYAIKAGLALNCEIAEFTKFDRKNYYYPDLPKNYQLSQFDLPICQQGYLEIEINDNQKKIGINRIHMEEDAGKLVHQGDNIARAEYSLVDCNRSSVPLLEIVSEPDMRSAEEARVYLEKLKAILEYLDISDCKMEEGSLRCDANVSIRPRGQRTLGTKTEIKNMNSFRSLQRAVEYEIERQIDAKEAGEPIVQETRGWDEVTGVTLSMRSKEEADDYRYFPEPDLPPLRIDRAWVEELQQQQPELPAARKERFIQDYGLPNYDAEILTNSRALADFYEASCSLYPNPKVVSNWVMGELLHLLNAENLEITQSRVTPERLAEMLQLIDKGTISGKLAKTVLEEMFKTGQPPQAIVQAKGLVQITDESALTIVVDQVLEANPKVVEDYRKGKGKALGFLVGQVMKQTRGQASPEVVNRLLKTRL